MELIIISYVCFVITLAHVILYKVNYFKHTAICLEYTAGRAFTSFPLYEYEIEEAGKKIVYRNQGVAVFYPKKGKRYKVLIHKKNHNKIVGYSEFIRYLIIASLLFLCISIEIIWMFL